LLESIRDNEKELDFFKQVVAIALSEDELIKIRQKSNYDSIEHKYKIPNFVLRNQKVVLPKLTNHQFNDLKQTEVESRELDFNVSGSFQENGHYDLRQGKENKFNKYDQYRNDKYPNNAYGNLLSGNLNGN